MIDRIICIFAYLGISVILCLVLCICYKDFTDKQNGLILLVATICFFIAGLCIFLPY